MLKVSLHTFQISNNSSCCTYICNLKTATLNVKLECMFQKTKMYFYQYYIQNLFKKYVQRREKSKLNYKIDNLVFISLNVNTVLKLNGVNKV